MSAKPRSAAAEVVSRSRQRARQLEQVCQELERKVHQLEEPYMPDMIPVSTALSWMRELAVLAGMSLPAPRLSQVISVHSDEVGTPSMFSEGE